MATWPGNYWRIFIILLLWKIDIASIRMIYTLLFIRFGLPFYHDTCSVKSTCKSWRQFILVRIKGPVNLVSLIGILCFYYMYTYKKICTISTPPCNSFYLLLSNLMCGKIFWRWSGSGKDCLDSNLARIRQFSLALARTCS